MRRGRAIGRLEEALAPLNGRVPAPALKRPAPAIRATIGIEAFVWLTHVGGLDRADAVELMRESARTLLRAALADAAA